MAKSNIPEIAWINRITSLEDEVQDLKTELNGALMLLCILAERSGGVLKFTYKEMVDGSIFNLEREDTEDGHVVYHCKRVGRLDESELQSRRA